jgi:glycosyltransferase involved in cell wall biosynthesis
VRIVLVASADRRDLDEAPSDDLRRGLQRLGHAVTVLTPRGVAGRDRPGSARFPASGLAALDGAGLCAWLVRHARRYDVVHAAAQHRAAAVGGILARRPVVVADPASAREDAATVEARLARAARARPRAVLLGRTPVDHALAVEERIEILTRHLRPTIVGTGPPVIRRVRGARVISIPETGSRAAGAALFAVLAPLVAVALSAGRRRTAVVCRSPSDALATVSLARALPRSLRPRVVVELHRDWRPDRDRRTFSGFARDRLAASALARADRVRVVDGRTARLATEFGRRAGTDRFSAFDRYDLFLGAPPVDPPGGARVLFAGAVEPANGADVLFEAWRLVHARRPDAVLAVAGAGSLSDVAREGVAREGAAATGAWTVRPVGRVAREEVRNLMDQASIVVAPAPTDALERVVVEAFARARPVVSTCTALSGALLEGERGVLVPPGDAAMLAAAILRLLDDLEAAAAMGRRARSAFERGELSAEYEAGIERLARWIDAG